MSDGLSDEEFEIVLQETRGTHVSRFRSSALQTLRHDRATHMTSQERLTTLTNVLAWTLREVRRRLSEAAVHDAHDAILSSLGLIEQALARVKEVSR